MASGASFRFWGIFWGQNGQEPQKFLRRSILRRLASTGRFTTSLHDDQAMRARIRADGETTAKVVAKVASVFRMEFRLRIGDGTARVKTRNNPSHHVSKHGPPILNLEDWEIRSSSPGRNHIEHACDPFFRLLLARGILLLSISLQVNTPL